MASTPTTNLASLRRMARVSREQLAARSGLPLETVAKLEEGNPLELRINEVVAIADLLGAAPADILPRLRIREPKHASRPCNSPRSLRRHELAEQRAKRPAAIVRRTRVDGPPDPAEASHGKAPRDVLIAGRLVSARRLGSLSHGSGG